MLDAQRRPRLEPRRQLALPSSSERERRRSSPCATRWARRFRWRSAWRYSAPIATWSRSRVTARLLMCPNVLATVAAARPSNLTALLWVNGHYESSGGQALPSAPVDWPELAKGFGIANVERVGDVPALRAAFPRARGRESPGAARRRRGLRSERADPALLRATRRHSGAVPDRMTARRRPRGRRRRRHVHRPRRVRCAGSRRRSLKVPTTPANPAGGVLERPGGGRPRGGPLRVARPRDHAWSRTRSSSAASARSASSPRAASATCSRSAA